MVTVLLTPYLPALAQTSAPGHSLAPVDKDTEQRFKELDEMRVQLNRQLGDLISLSTTLRYEEDPAIPYNVSMDEAFIRLENADASLGLTTGRTAVPFALLDSGIWHERSNPEYDSHSDNVAILTARRGKLSSDLYLFKGDGDSDGLQHNGGMNLRYRPARLLELEVGYLSNISNTGLMHEAEQVPAVRLGAELKSGALRLNSEYVQTDKVQAENNQRPAVSHMMLDYELEALTGTPVNLALSYSISHEAGFLDLYERQGLLSLQRQLNTEVKLGIELQRRKDYLQKPADSLSFTLDTKF